MAGSAKIFIIDEHYGFQRPPNMSKKCENRNGACADRVNPFKGVKMVFSKVLEAWAMI